METFDALIMVTPKDYVRLENNYHRMIKNLPVRRVLFVGSTEVESLVRNSGLGEKAGAVNEDLILPFAAVHDVMKDVLRDILGGQELSRGITGWYYQQFLKMRYAYVSMTIIWSGMGILYPVGLSPCSMRRAVFLIWI